MISFVRVTFLLLGVVGRELTCTTLVLLRTKAVCTSEMYFGPASSLSLSNTHYPGIVCCSAFKVDRLILFHSSRNTHLCGKQRESQTHVDL